MHFHSRILLNQSAPWNNRRGGRAPDLFAPPPLHFFQHFEGDLFYCLIMPKNAIKLYFWHHVWVPKKCTKYIWKKSGHQREKNWEDFNPQLSSWKKLPFNGKSAKFRQEPECGNSGWHALPTRATLDAILPKGWRIFRGELLVSGRVSTWIFQRACRYWMMVQKSV